MVNNEQVAYVLRNILRVNEDNNFEMTGVENGRDLVNMTLHTIR